jgi:hypothetical protein
VIYGAAIVPIEHFDDLFRQCILMDIAGVGAVVCFAAAGIMYLLFIF